MSVPGIVVAVVGPTATGKSGLGVELALRLEGEVVGADASQLYRGMDIGTAKVTETERRGVSHHQIDVLDIHEDASVAAYQREARRDVQGVAGRGRVPVVVGGSGLYVRALLDRLDIPPTDPVVRERLEAAAAADLPGLRDRLTRVDPEAAAAIESSNARRIVRALEVVELTGRPFSASLPRREFVRPTVMVELDVDRGELDRRIATRAERMWQEGLLDEVARLAERGLAATRTASRAVGYRQGLDVLAGRSTPAEAVADTIAATRRLAKRQRRWFRADPRIVRIPVDGAVDAVLRLVEDTQARDGRPA